MFEILRITCDQVIHSDDIETIVEKTIAQVGAEESRGTRDKNPFMHDRCG
jgi:hypothetical protein